MLTKSVIGEKGHWLNPFKKHDQMNARMVVQKKQCGEGEMEI